MSQIDRQGIGAQSQYGQQSAAARGIAGINPYPSDDTRHEAAAARAQSYEPSAFAEPKVPVAKRITVTVAGPMSGRTEREFREELAGKIAAGYRVAQLVDQPRGRCVLHLEKYEDWTLDELMSEITSKTKDSF